MNLKYKEITIREAVPADAEQLCTWWNDGSVMAHAGFPNGLGITKEAIIEKLEVQDVQNTCRHIIEYEGRSIGEMNYIRMNETACEMGIKICESDMQNQGIGKVVLSLFISGLFEQLGYDKICLDTNLNNKRAQHVYEQLGFQKVRVNMDSWKNQLGELQSSVDYELTRDDFQSYFRDVYFRKMSLQEFDLYYENSIADYAKDLMKGENLKQEQAMVMAREEFSNMLPDGIETKDNFLMMLIDRDSGRMVGIIWYLYEFCQEIKQVFLSDLLIYEKERRKGYAMAALTEMEKLGKEAGCKESIIYVWKHNPAGIQLYKKCKYVTFRELEDGMYLKKKI